VATEERDAAQQARNAQARRELSRACGVSLLGITSILDSGAKVGTDADATDLMLLALGARGRRILRSAYRLLDEGERSEAAILFRVMQDYLIRSRWLLRDEENLKLWTLDDLRKSVATIDKIANDPNLDEETKESTRKHGEQARANLAEFVGLTTTEIEAEEETKVCPECKRPLKKRKRPSLPTLEQMAAETDLSLPYNLPYRLSSQGEIHATPLLVNYTLERGDDGVTVREQPGFSMEGWESYAVGAHLLLDLLRPIAVRWPELEWGPQFDAVQTTLEAMRAADPDSQSYKDKAAAKEQLDEEA
jgi:uncharacterized protein DUF5677